MCVLVVADKRRPTIVEIEKMFAQNPDGAGIAWRDVGNNSPRDAEPNVIKWEKGLDLANIKELSNEAPLPYVLHFRLASCGGKLKELTHPFPVEKDVRGTLSGETRGKVLFHNGHWGPWKDKGIDGAIRNKVRVPEGKWNDTRVMAWLAHLHGSSILELIDEKVILFGPKSIEIFHPDGWFRIEGDLLVSNTIWERQYIHHQRDNEDWDYIGSGTYQHNPTCRFTTCNNTAMHNTWYCHLHQPLCQWANCKLNRIDGTSHCLMHQPLCQQNGCTDMSVPTKHFCVKHLNLPIKDGSLIVIPEQSGSLSLKTEVKETEDTRLAVLVDPVLQSMKRWACSINKPAHKSTVM